MISDPWFYAVAIPAVLITAISQGGFKAPPSPTSIFYPYLLEPTARPSKH